MVEYVQFIALIGALYIAASGILLDVNVAASPLVNVAFLWFGAILSNLIGTTGASMLLIRPFLRLNGTRVKPYHVVFFIFMVSNVGGALTAIADPPNFIGYLKGVPFFWTLKHNFLPWLLGLSLLSVVFYAIDFLYAKQDKDRHQEQLGARMSITLQGRRNIVWLAIVIGAVFIDPNLSDWVPYLPYHGHKISFVRELILLGTGYLAYRQADRSILQANGFSLAPLKEVVFIFLGIFATMQPALLVIDKLAQHPKAVQYITPSLLYWLTGSLSSVLDNAPTYLNFLTAGMSAQGLDVNNIAEVSTYACRAVPHLKATSVSSVFFGAMTYIGNGPNFMVRSIALENKVRMPSFGTYLVRYSLPLLAPILAVVWAIFFR